MADPLTTFDVVSVAAVVVALVGAVGILWKAFKSQVDELKALRKVDREDITELVQRVRTMEQHRLDEVKEYASKLESMSRQQMTVFSRAINAIQDITKAVSEWSKRPCQLADSSEPRPQLAQIDTEALFAKEEKITKRKQEESSRP